MKRLLGIFLTLAISITFFACDGDENKGGDPGAVTSGEGTTSEITTTPGVTTTPEVTTTTPQTQPDTSFEEKVDVYDHGLWLGKQGEYLTHNSYYHYSSLSSGERELYDKIVSAIQTMQNVVTVDKIKLNSEKGFLLLDKIIADNPQFFWLSNSITVTYDKDGKNITSFVLRYTDGKKIDVLNGDYKLTSSADRKVINSQISTLNTKVQNIVSLIPANASDAQKEKIIHDYIINHNVYDDRTANSSSNSVTSHSYDMYGSLVEGTSVCEGYAEAFQYLCYCVGINATQIHGKSAKNGQQHMWNAVKIDNEWYQIDLTWDDVEDPEYVYYEYFNLTDKEMGKTHIADTNGISFPACNGGKHEHADCFVLEIASDKKTTVNHEAVLKNLISENGSYVVLSVKGVKVTSDLLSKLIYSKNSPINVCARKLGVTLMFETKVSGYGDYVYISVKVLLK